MDSAIIGVLSRTVYLPAENPWFSGTPFTSYYYFGHFMAATLTRTFQTPLPYAYNLVQPVFCAFFISILWSLCASLMGSRRKGLAVTVAIAFCGNYEPLRQWYIASQNASPFWPLDWWSTSRVIPDTINEYPFFTLALGDAHAHFFGLSLFVLFLCTCLRTQSNTGYSYKNLFLQAMLASVTIMANAWEFPILAFVTLFFLWRKCKMVGFWKAVYTSVAWLFLVVLLAMPFLRDFHSPTRGLKWEPHWPEFSFLLVWGHLILLATLLLLQLKRVRPAELINKPYSLSGIACAGIVTLIFPYLFFIQGHFEGALRFQDTVFKFGLQSWILLGIALGTCITQHLPKSRWPRMLFGCAIAVILFPTVTASTAVFLARSDRDSTQRLSLNGARYLPLEEQAALAWLTTNALPGDSVIESAGRNANGTWVGAYSDYARVSSLTGIPATIGWPQHAAFWGVNPTEIAQRLKETDQIYLSRTERQTLTERGSSILQSPPTTRARYIFWGSLEYATYGQPDNTNSVFAKSGAAILSNRQSP